MSSTPWVDHSYVSLDRNRHRWPDGSIKRHLYEWESPWENVRMVPGLKHQNNDHNEFMLTLNELPASDQKWLERWMRQMWTEWRENHRLTTLSTRLWLSPGNKMNKIFIKDFLSISIKTFSVILQQLMRSKSHLYDVWMRPYLHIHCWWSQHTNWEYVSNKPQKGDYGNNNSFNKDFTWTAFNRFI